MKVFHQDSFSPATGRRIMAMTAVSLLFASACSKEEVTLDQKGIKDAVIRFDKSISEAQQKLDVRPLEGTATEREISKNESIITVFVKKKIYMESELMDIKFESFTAKPDSRAEVVAQEVWRWRHLDAGTKKEVKPWVREVYRIRYEVLKDDKQGWLVDSVKILEQSTLKD